MANYYTRFSMLIENITAEERAWLEPRLREVDESDVQFGWAFEDDGYLWLHDDDRNEIENAADFIQRFLIRWRPTAVVWFTWAATCDKPRLDAYDGGAVVISAGETEWMSGSQWGQQIARQMETAVSNEQQAT